MPIITAHHTIGLTPIKIVSAQSMSQHVCIHNHEHSSNSTIYIGGSDVSVNNGIHAQATLTSQITIGPGDDLWAVADVDNAILHTLIVRQD